MKIVLTGGTGFIGGNLIPVLLDAGHEVLALAREKPRLAEPDPALDWIETDLSSADWNLNHSLPPAVDAVIHLAQSKHYREFPEKADSIYAVNTAATFKLLHYGQKAGASHFIYASSGSVYNGITKPTLSEDDSIDPSNFSDSPLGFYCASKFAGEVLVEGFRTGYQSTSPLRIFAPYGQGGDAALVNRLANRVWNDEPIDIQGNPGLTINPIHVDDVTQIIAQLLTKQEPIGPLNVAGQDKVSLTDIVRMAGEICGTAPNIQYTKVELGSGGTLIADTQKLKSLGLKTGKLLHAGLLSIFSERCF